MTYSLSNHSLGYGVSLDDMYHSLTTGLSGAPYAQRHLQLADEQNANAWGHKTIAKIQNVPLLGAVVALIDAIVNTIIDFFTKISSSQSLDPKRVGDSIPNTPRTASSPPNFNLIPEDVIDSLELPFAEIAEARGTKISMRSLAEKVIAEINQCIKTGNLRPGQEILLNLAPCESSPKQIVNGFVVIPKETLIPYVWFGLEQIIIDAIYKTVSKANTVPALVVQNRLKWNSESPNYPWIFTICQKLKEKGHIAETKISLYESNEFKDTLFRYTVLVTLNSNLS